MRHELILIAAALFLASCNSKDNENNPDLPHSAAVSASATVNAATAASTVQNSIVLNSPGTIQNASHETFKDHETAYVIAPLATVDMNGAIITLPIGTQVWVKEECSTEMDPDDSEPPSICVYLGDIISDGIDWGFPDGFAPASSLGHKLPTLTGLLEEYDKLTPDNKETRREYAQMASALDPWSKDAHDRLIATLTAIGDQKDADIAEASYKQYLAHQVKIYQGELPTIFSYKGDKLIPIASIEHGIIKVPDFKTVTLRGRFLQVYGDQPAGFVVTTWSFSSEGNYPAFIPVISIGLDGKPTASNLKGSYATNFPWPERHTLPPAVTSKQKSLLLSKLREKIMHDYTGEAVANAEEQLKSGKIDVFTGQLSADGRVFLLGSLKIGSAGDEHYNNIPYVFELVMMEQQKDGSLAEAQADIDKLREGYCGISGILRDIDGDGTDEITTECNSYVEGPGGDWNGILQRINNRWTVAF